MKPNREEVLKIAQECGIGVHHMTRDVATITGYDLYLERFAAVMYEAGAKSERAVADRLLDACNNLIKVSGRFHTEQAFSRLQFVIAEVEAMRKEQE